MFVPHPGVSRSARFRPVREINGDEDLEGKNGGVTERRKGTPKSRFLLLFYGHVIKWSVVTRGI